MTNEAKKVYTIKGKVIGTYNTETVDIDIELSDSELERIKTLIMDSDCDDFRQVIKDEFPKLYDYIDTELAQATYNYYKYKDDVDYDDGPWLEGDEYTCPIPKEWLVKYNFKVMVALTHDDEDIEVGIPLSDEDVAEAKKLISDYDIQEDTSLLEILEDADSELFDKFWDAIFPKVFIEMLIDGFHNWAIERDDDDDFDDYREADFDEVYDMYGDQIDIEHSSVCICRIPKEWLPKKETKR